MDGLPPEEAKEAVILASNEGRAGAVDTLGPAVGLPPVISGYGSFWYWGTSGASGRVVVAVGGDEAMLRAHFRSVELVTVFGHSLAAPRERRIRIYVCKESTEPLETLWPALKTYD
jgi:hypothetical protein